MRPAVLLIDPHETRRQGVASWLAERGYEVVPTANPVEGRKFALGLEPGVVVGDASVPGLEDGTFLDGLPPLLDPVTGRELERTLVVLGPAADADQQRPDSVRYLATPDLEIEEISRRIRLVLLGREIGVEPDVGLRYLVGDLTRVPLVELVRHLHAAWVSGVVQLADGSIAFERGRPLAAQLGKIVGDKAFHRMAQRAGGPFRIHLGRPERTPNLEADYESLLVGALEEAHREPPDRHLRLRLTDPRKMQSGEFTLAERELAIRIEHCETVGEALDQIPAPDALVMQALEKMQSRGHLVFEPAKAAVRVITDSTSDLPPEMAREHDLLVVPLSIHFGKTTYRDGVDIRARDFYQLLRESDEHPSTQPPDQAEFFEHFHELIVDQDLLCIHISEKLSQTAVHARQAAMQGMRAFDHLPTDRHRFALEVVDSQSVSIGTGLQALFAARMAARGEGVVAIARRLRAMPERTHLFFAVDTLEYLQRGGRIGKAQAVVGKWLSIKPILGVVDGEVVAVDRARGGRRVHPRIVQLVRQAVDPERGLVVAIAHAQAAVWADRLRALFEEAFEVLEIIVTEMGPVVGTHAGPGSVGALVYQPVDEEEWDLIKPLDDGARSDQSAA